MTLTSSLRKKLIIGGVVAVLALMALVTFNGAQRTMVAKESALTAQYGDCQNTLSSYISQIKEALGVADRASAQLDEVLSDVVKGRYETGSTAQPGSGSAFSAIVEAYPNLDAMNLNYANVQSAIFAGRDGFKNCQTRMLDLIRDYQTWKDSGLIASRVNAIVGAPSDGLKANTGRSMATGEMALTRMSELVLTSDTRDAYESGEMDPLDTNPTAPATPTPEAPAQETPAP